MAAVPATAQLADPLSLAASGVLLPFFSDPAAGFVSILEIASPVVPTTQGFTPPFNFTNPLHAVFFTATCARDKSTGDVQTAKQAKAYISSAAPFLLTYNGLAAIGRTLEGNDLLPLNFPIHSRTHWIDVKTGRLRELEPIILDTFFRLNPAFLPLIEDPGAGASIGLCSSPPGSTNNGFCWSPLRSAATFVTPQESASIKASLILICPTATIQSSSGSGVFPFPVFPRLVNRDGSFGFSSNTLRGRIYDDNEDLKSDFQLACSCLTTVAVTAIDNIYTFPPTNLGAHTVPVWYTELESVNQSFTGYWNLEVTGQAGTLFHRLSNASLDNLSFGTANNFANR
jgi:hypothetical protein